MNPLQSRILRVVARLGSGADLRNANGDIAGVITDSVPMLFVWIEFWDIRIDGGFGGDTAIGRCVESLKRDGFLKPSSPSLFLPCGKFAYRALNGTVWELESESHDEVFHGSGEHVVTIPNLRQVVLAAPQETIEKFHEYLSRNPLGGTQNLFTRYGMATAERTHPCVSVTDLGWDSAGLGTEDFVTRPGNGPVTKPGGGQGGERADIFVENVIVGDQITAQASTVVTHPEVKGSSKIVRDDHSTVSASNPPGWIARLSESVAAQVVATLLAVAIIAVAILKWPWIKEFLG